MISDLPEGAALLVAGHGMDDRPVHTLGSIGEALLATPARWRIKRMSPGAGERYAPNRAALKRMLDQLAGQVTEVALFVCAGAIVGDVPVLVTGPGPELYPEEDALPLRWIADRLRDIKATRLIALIAATGGSQDKNAKWLEAVRTHGERDLIAVGGTDALDALLAGLCGSALDRRTGTITLRSLGAHLVKSVPGLALQPSTASETVASPPPLGLLWDIRASAKTRTMHDRPTGAAPIGSDLTGVVLPGRFRVDGELARGSFGVVYRARQLTVDRDVAVKIMHVGLDPSSEDGRLFVQEIQAVGRIDHQNVVRIHQADVTPDGRLFFAMELLGGRDLRKLAADEGLMPPERAVALIRPLLAGLGAAHDAGLVHADVKPANALVVDGKDGERVVLVDFGLARLKPQDGAVESLGGTPAFMAPEQLRGERIDARADLFSTALVLVSLITGWRRTSAEELVPPLDGIEPELRRVLERALAIDPTDRYQSAADFADALAGKTPLGEGSSSIRTPFHHLASFTERDAGRLHGRERDLALLVEQTLYGRASIYTAPSGTGKTSLLRAGLVPRLGALGVRAVYFSCRAGGAEALAAAIAPGTTTIADAIATHHLDRKARLVIILDQVETALETDAGDQLIAEVLAFDRWPVDLDMSVVLSVREDFLARLIGHRNQIEEGVPIVRLGPLRPDGAREAISLPLAEARLAIDPELLDALLVDLQQAAGVVGAELGWGTVPAVYPPHLQLACSALYETLGRGETTLTLAHYRELGGLDAIVGEHLDRVLDRELDDTSARVARDVFLALVTATQSRAVRSETELIEDVGGTHGKETVLAVLDVLRMRGLMVRVRAAGGEPAWELVHDSLVPRILAWIDRRDLARRRAIELVRYHLRRSRAAVPSLLNRAELREIKDHAGAIEELDGEWARRPDEPWTPSRLVASSRRALRRQLGIVGTTAVVILGIAGLATASWAGERARARREQTLKDRDIGRFALELAPFEWDPKTLATRDVAAAELPGLSWTLAEPDSEDEDAPGTSVADHLLVRHETSTTDLIRIDHVEAHAGRAFLIIDGRGRNGERCPPAIIPFRQLPGYASRDKPEIAIRVRVPTCQVTRHDMIDIPAGPFLYGGPGEPPSDVRPAERTVELRAFSIDRTEATNAEFAVFAGMEPTTGIAMPYYPDAPGDAVPWRSADLPVTNVTWLEARAYCRFVGKDLPESLQWEKSMRGGLVMPDDRANPHPRRNLPWGDPISPSPAHIDAGVDGGPAPVGSHPGDVSPYGVLDLAGNVTEWTASTSNLSSRQFRVSRGGNWGETTADSLLDYMAIENPRAMGFRQYIVGLRCASTTR